MDNQEELRRQRRALKEEIEAADLGAGAARTEPAREAFQGAGAFQSAGARLRDRKPAAPGLYHPTQIPLTA